MFTNNKFKQLDAVAEMIKDIADADAKIKMDEMRGIIAGHNKLEVPVTENLNEASSGNAFDWKNKPSQLPTKPGEKAGFDSKKISTGTVYQKKWKKEPEKDQKDESVDPTVTTTDTLAGRTKGGAPNQHSSFKVKLKAEEMEKEELVGKQHKLDKNKNGKLDSQDFKMLRKEEEELEEKTAPWETDAEASKREKEASNFKKPNNPKRSGMDTAKALAQRGLKKGMKEEVEELDELSKSTLGSYAKKASRDAVMTRKIGADFENQAKKARSPGMKAASDEISQKYKEKSWKRRDGVDKAVDRLTKEEVELDEAKSNYELYHSQYSGAIHHALAHHASKSGLSVSDDDYHHHVSIGPRKPAEGASVSHSLPATDENGGKHMIHMQIYNRGGDKKPYELNTYSSKIAKTSGRTMKEDTELDERTLSPAEKDALEVNVKSMKKNLAGFKARYGKDAKSVMYATATARAKK